MLKVIIAGSRGFNNYELLAKVCDHMLQNHEDVEIVSGGAPGADKLGELYGEQYGYDTKTFLPNESKYGNTAGYLQNYEMVGYSDALIAFYNWDENKKFLHLIQIARDSRLKVKICEY